MDTNKSEDDRDSVSEPYYPSTCLKYGHDHSGESYGSYWTAHTDQCKNRGGLLWLIRCEHMQTHEEAILEAHGGKWPDPPPPPPPPPPKEVHVYHHDATPTIKPGQTITLTIPGTFDHQRMKVVSIRKNGKTKELRLKPL